jgi:flavin-dependent dehydrogenase
MSTAPRTVEVAIVGGGLAGSVLATRLASLGKEVAVIERSPRWRWKAGGVFASPASVGELVSAGLPRSVLEAVAHPIPAMRVETRGRVAFRLTYGAAADGTGGAVGFDRAGLDQALLGLAETCGAIVLRGHSVVTLEPRSSAGSPGRLIVRDSTGTATVHARVVVGADGIRSVVARSVGVARPAPLGQRVGLTWHVTDAMDDRPRDARMVLLDGAYCGLAPVPGGRLNVGIVLSGRRWRARLMVTGAADVGARVLRSVPSPAEEPEPWRDGDLVDGIVGASPLGHRVTRRAGPGWLLVGDAGGFLDPFTGEGIHRALVSARLAADAIARLSRGTRRDEFGAYERAMRARFLAKDVVSLVVQGFLARPTLLEYAARRLASRHGLRETLGLVMGDLIPASRALDPRYLAALLAP